MDAGEKGMIFSIFDLGDTLAREIMVPRVDVLALDVTVPPNGALELVLEKGFSRLPVYRDTIDDVVGLLYAKDLLQYLREEEMTTDDLDLTSLLRPAHQESTPDPPFARAISNARGRSDRRETRGGDAVNPTQALVAAALETRERAYVPYSNFAVGAALRTASGRVFGGCNVENVSFGLTICAERVALTKAVSEGERDFEAIAVVSRGGATPCGACRQVLAEFNPDLRVIVVDLAGNQREFPLSALLPEAFLPDHL